MTRCPCRRRRIQTRCAILILSLLVPATAATEALPADTAEAAAGSRPNIVLVMADDQGWGDMAYNGHPVLKTPHFDQAAASGLRFDRFYAAAPVCSPTRASVMTGRHPNRMGVFKWGYPIRGISTPSATWMGELLAAQRAGGDLPPHPSSQRAAELPQPPYPTDKFPGHAAWIDGDWKLHRIVDDQEQVAYQLYDLATDPHETTDRSGEQPQRVAAMSRALEDWLRSVVNSLNGADY